MEKKLDNLEFSIPQASHNSSAWVLSYCDLLCQLICFFVLLFASASVKNEQWEEIRNSLSQRLAPNKDALTNNPAAEISIEKETVTVAQDLGYLNIIIRDKFLNSPLKDQVLVQQKDDRLIISMVGENTFVAGSHHMTPILEKTVAEVSDVIRTIPNRIEIHGNTDTNPVSGKKYASNWELSLSRALVVSEQLHGHGYPHPLRVYGRGDGAYAELPSNLDPLKREQLARRIDIVIRADSAY